LIAANPSNVIVHLGTRAADGYYYFAATAGQFPWAGLFTW
jgi:hypothetical protein